MQQSNGFAVIINAGELPPQPAYPMHSRWLSPLALFLLTSFPGTSCGNDAAVADPGVPISETPLVGGDGSAGTIRVDAGTTYQTMDGFGTSMRLFDDPHLNGLSNTASTGGLAMTGAQKDTIYDLLYSPTRGIGLNRLRVNIIEPGWQKSEGGALVTEAPYPGPHAADMVAFIKQALIRNPELRTGFQATRFDGWISNSTNPRAFARYIKTALDYARASGHEPDWVGIQNEPSNSPPYFSGSNLRDITIELKNILKAGGYSTRISAPDDLQDGPGAPKAAEILQDPEARSSIKALSIHLYGDESPTAMAALSKQYNLPLWMTEYHDESGDAELGWASNIVHEMVVTYDCSAVDMLFGFFKSPPGADYAPAYIGLQSTGNTYNGYRLSAAYFQMGQWSKYVTRGSVRIEASSNSPNVKVSAFVKDGKKVVVLIHPAQVSESFAIPRGDYRLIRTQMSGSDRLTYKGVITGAVTLPSMSVSTLVER